MVFQIFLIVFSGYAIARSVRQYARKDVSKYWMCVWSVLWFVVIGVALMPQATDRIAAFAGVGRGADLLVYLAVIFLLYAVLRLMVRQQNMSAEITELVRTIAIDHAKRSERT
jgi:small membrane protein